MTKIKITPKMLVQNVAVISLENEVNNHGETLQQAMIKRAKRKGMKLSKKFWLNHEPLTVIKNSLLEKEIILYYQTRFGNFNKYANRNINGFIENKKTNGDPEHSFYFHVQTDSYHPASAKEILSTLLISSKSIPDFIKFVNNHIGN